MSLLARLRPTKYTAHYPGWIVGKPLLIASSALASLGDAMFGYSQGIIAGIQVQPKFIERMYGLKDVTQEAIQNETVPIPAFTQAITVSCLNITALIASLLAAYICDILGRRMSVRIGAIIYLLAAILQIFAPSLTVLIIGRCIQGLGVGFLSMTVPVIQAEIAPGHSRGLFVCIEYLCLNGGYAMSAWVGYAFFFTTPNEISWRGPYIIQAALAVILVLWTFVLPETPRWLIKNGFLKEGLQTIADLQGTGDISDPVIKNVYDEIVAAITHEQTISDGEAGWLELFTKYTRRTIMGLTSQMFAQLNGINALLYFLPENLLRAGFNIPQSLLYSGGCALLYCAGTIPAMFLVDRWGRKPLLLLGSIGLACCLAVVGALQLHEHTIPRGPDRIPIANGIYAMVCLYLFLFGASWGPVPWLLPAEIFPLRARARGMALATGSNWIWNFIVAFITPPLFKVLGGGYYFLIVGFVVISFFLVLFVYRETAHCTLEELSQVFGEVAYVNEYEKPPVPRRQGSGGSDKTLRASIGGVDRKINIGEKDA